MKTIFTLFILAILFTGCEKPKDYNCVCTITETSMFNSSYSSTHQETHKIYNKKRKAEKICDNYEPEGIQIWAKTECTIQ